MCLLVGDVIRALCFVLCDANLLGQNINATKKIIKALLYVNKKEEVEVNMEDSGCTFVSCHQSSGLIHNIKIANEYFENVTTYKSVTNQSHVYEEVMRKINLGNAS
jgi:hypothetical protein